MTGGIEDKAFSVHRWRALKRVSVQLKVQVAVQVVVDLESGTTGLNAASAIHLSFGFLIYKMEPKISTSQRYED